MSEKIYQYSEFIKTSTQDGQYVIRADSIEEFKRAHTAMKQALGLEAVKTEVRSEEPPHPAETKPTYQYGKCPKCEAELVKNPKNGNIFCKDKCWLR